MDIVSQTLLFMEAEKNRKYIIQHLKFNVDVKWDHMGYIIDPIDTKYKCGWGYDLTEAMYHCAARNNIEL